MRYLSLLVGVSNSLFMVQASVLFILEAIYFDNFLLSLNLIATRLVTPSSSLLLFLNLRFDLELDLASPSAQVIASGQFE